MNENAKECSPNDIPKGRVEAALHASYELESLSMSFPIVSVSDTIDVADEYIQRLFVNRIMDLARVVMSALDDDRTTNELRKIVGLPEINHG